MRKLWIELRSSLWFVPALLVLAGIVLAIGLVEIDLFFGDRLELARWGTFLGAGAEGARGMLTAIASSIITVAGVAFSITIVTLSLASTQYTPRILRNFMRDRANQFVLGAFVGIYVYCLIVLRTIRGSNGGADSFVQLLAVFFALLLALLGIACLIFFIHHVAASIQASSILEAITKETLAAVEHLFPEELGEAGDDVAAQALDEETWHPIAASATGYIQTIDPDVLLRVASEADTVLRLERGIGDFVVQGAPLISSARELMEETVASIRAAYAVGNFRTVEQDGGFGIRQIVDIAMKALSPGINDTSTAVSCIDYLSAILSRLAARRMESPFRRDGEKLRVIAPAASFSDFLAKSLDEIRLSAPGNVSIILQMLCLIGRVAAVTRNANRRSALLDHARIISELADHSVGALYDRSRIDEGLTRVREMLSAGEQLPPLRLSRSEPDK